jgi:hypothetical protein
VLCLWGSGSGTVENGRMAELSKEREVPQLVVHMVQMAEAIQGMLGHDSQRRQGLHGGSWEGRAAVESETCRVSGALGTSRQE